MKDVQKRRDRGMDGKIEKEDGRGKRMGEAGGGMGEV